MDFGIKDKVAVITGGGSGIGKAVADLLAIEGVKLALVGRTQSKLSEAAQELSKHTEAIPVVADIQRFASK